MMTGTFVAIVPFNPGSVTMITTHTNTSELCAGSVTMITNHTNTIELCPALLLSDEYDRTMNVSYVLNLQSL